MRALKKLLRIEWLFIIISLVMGVSVEIFYWIGKNASIDLRGAVALKVQLFMALEAQ